MDRHIELSVGKVAAVTGMAVLGIIFVKWTSAAMAHSNNPWLKKAGTAAQYAMNAA